MRDIPTLIGWGARGPYVVTTGSVTTPRETWEAIAWLEAYKAWAQAQRPAPEPKPATPAPKRFGAAPAPEPPDRENIPRRIGWDADRPPVIKTGTVVTTPEDGEAIAWLEAYKAQHPEPKTTAPHAFGTVTEPESTPAEDVPESIYWTSDGPKVLATGTVVTPPETQEALDWLEAYQAQHPEPALPEPVVAEAQPEADTFMAEPAPQPDAVVAEAQPEPEAAVAEPDPVVAETEAAEPVPAVTPPEPQPEPAPEAVAPSPEPEPEADVEAEQPPAVDAPVEVAEAPAAEATPPPVVVEEPETQIV
jgi:hypothetical protein